MGRKRLDHKKVPLTLRVDPQLNEQLKEAGINKSRFFEIAARIYLRKKGRK